MELWEFNAFLEGYKYRIKEKEKTIIKVAYYTAAFNNSKKTKKLSSYLDAIDKVECKTNKKDNKKLDFAKRMYHLTKKDL